MHVYTKIKKHKFIYSNEVGVGRGALIFTAIDDIILYYYDGRNGGGGSFLFYYFIIITNYALWPKLLPK